MIKQILKFEFSVEGKVSHFLLDHDTPVYIAKEMAFQFLKYLGQLEDQAKKEEQEKAQVALPENTPETPKEG